MGYNTEVVMDMMEADDDDGQGGLANGDGDPCMAARFATKRYVCCPPRLCTCAVNFATLRQRKITN
jgi:hypothetical protein